MLETLPNAYPCQLVACCRGRGMSTLTKIGIVVGVAIVVVGVAVAVAIKNFDPFEGGITAR
jgi:hypothetical protein